MHKALIPTKNDSEKRLIFLLRHHEFGLRGSEISHMLDIEYWKIRLFLQKLSQEQRIYREGQFWYAD